MPRAGGPGVASRLSRRHRHRSILQKPPPSLGCCQVAHGEIPQRPCSSSPRASEVLRTLLTSCGINKVPLKPTGSYPQGGSEGSYAYDGEPDVVSQVFLWSAFGYDLPLLYIPGPPA